MKKLIAVCLTLICIITMIIPSVSAIDLQKNNYTVTQSTTKDGSETTTDTYTYDSKGNLTKHVYSSKVGKLPAQTQTTTYTYDSSNRLTKIVETDNAVIKTTDTYTYTYDSKSNVTKYTYTSKLGKITTESISQTYTYDDKGNMITSVEKNSGSDSNAYTETVTKTYDSKNRITKETYVIKYSDSTSQKTEYKYKYDSKGNITEISTTDNSFGSVSHNKKITVYDSSDRPTKETVTYESDGFIEKYETLYAYDSKGNITKITETMTDSDKFYQQDTTTNKYNSKGLITSSKTTRKDENGTNVTSTHTYTYNDAGLCIAESLKDIILFSTTRTETVKTTYDSKGRITKVITTNDLVSADEASFKIDMKTTETIVYSYDSKGNIIKENCKSSLIYNGDKSSEETTHDYAFDSNNNCTKDTYTVIADGIKSVSTTTTSFAKAKKAEYSETTDDLINGFKFSYVDSYVYPGKAVQPHVEIHAEFDRILLRGVDYTLSYSNNTKAGKGKITVKFIGEYYENESIQLPFTITTPQVKSLKTGTVKKDSINLTWSKLTGAKYYKVEKYDSANKKWVSVKSVDTNSLTVTGLKAGTSYSFRVTALDSAKKTFGKASATLKTQTLCSAPSIKLSSTKSKTATVSWSKVTGASKYTVYKSTDGKKFTKVADTTKTSYTLSKLSAGKKIYVKVVAVNNYAMNSSASAIKNITVKK